ncbi:acyltransferase [Gonapodya prolifera JEL478]|uniref:Acyltransferase n=1 Tax=Gonapodya prolifera (strain JEL478) TaxID=1344416 RepID=A0A139ASS2_GONPJ|nr:acyltransferase [Gonapodya prolifera JEL478]|eukprot:KXS19535.1 acyltransferase [Gonapodya prolifera JEL478]
MASSIIFQIKNALLAAISLFMMALAIPVGIVLYVVGHGYDTQYYVGRLASSLILKLFGWKVKVEGAEHLRTPAPAVFCSNHQATIDMLIQAYLQPKRTVGLGKKDLLYIPLLNAYVFFTNMFLIDRGNHDHAMATMARVSKTMSEKKLSLYIYPEGTRSNSSTPSLLPLKKGAFRVALGGGYPIVPVVVQNYSHIYSAKEKRLEPGTICVRILPPIETKGLELKDMDDLIQRTTNLMREALIEMSKRNTHLNGKSD